MHNEHSKTESSSEFQTSGESSKSDLDTLESLSTTLKGNHLPSSQLKNASMKTGKMISKISLEFVCHF
jgi:hypothetical protein